MRRIVAAAGATLPIGALLAVTALNDVPDAEIDGFIAEFAIPEPAAEDASQAEAAAPRDIDAAGRRLRYLETSGGSGIPVMLIHGFGGDLNTWMFTQPALAESRRTIALDLPGHGGSAKDVGSGDPETLADALDAAADAFGVDRAHLVGHSLGVRSPRSSPCGVRSGLRA